MPSHESERIADHNAHPGTQFAQTYHLSLKLMADCLRNLGAAYPIIKFKKTKYYTDNKYYFTFQ